MRSASAVFALVGLQAALISAQQTEAENARNLLLDVFEDAVVVEESGTSGPVVATCPEDTSIIFGWSYHYRGAPDSEPCILQNNKHCIVGETSCSTIACDGAGHDEMGVRILCSANEIPDLEATSLASANGSGSQRLTCPQGKSILFMFGSQYTSNFLYQSPKLPGVECVNLNTGIKAGSPFGFGAQVGDTETATTECPAPDSVLFRYLLCADSSFVQLLKDDGAGLADKFDFWETGRDIPPALDVQCPYTAAFGVKVAVADGFTSADSAELRSGTGICGFSSDGATCAQPYVSVGSTGVQFASALCTRPRAGTRPPVGPVPTSVPATRPPQTAAPTTETGEPGSPTPPPQTAPPNTPAGGGNNPQDTTRTSSSLDILFIGIGAAVVVTLALGGYLLWSSNDKHNPDSQGPAHGAALGQTPNGSSQFSNSNPGRSGFGFSSGTKPKLSKGKTAGQGSSQGKQTYEKSLRSQSSFQMSSQGSFHSQKGGSSQMVGGSNSSFKQELERSFSKNSSFKSNPGSFQQNSSFKSTPGSFQQNSSFKSKPGSFQQNSSFKSKPGSFQQNSSFNSKPGSFYNNSSFKSNPGSFPLLDDDV